MEALATLHSGRVRGLERRGLFNADSDRDDVAARLDVLAAAHRGAATAARSRRVLRELQES
jgi:hypothetical protein